MATSTTDGLRERLINELWALDAIRSREVEAAFRAVPREVFAPGEPLETVYAAETVMGAKADNEGNTTHCISAPRIQAFMLEQAGLRPGMRVLEIGSGGYNAALIAELVGEGGAVTSIDIDPEVTDRAARFLADTGYGGRVNVLTADAEHGAPDYGPYDRIIVTVEAPDIPPAWTGQLAPGGRIVVPLRMRGLTRSIAFNHQDSWLASTGYELCGFVPMQGAGADRIRKAVIHADGVSLRLDEDQQADAGRLAEALRGDRVEAWSGVTIGRMQSWAELDLWLATALDGFTVIDVSPSAREKGIVTTQGWPPALVEGGSFAYRLLRKISEEPPLFEFGAAGHGPNAKTTAEHLVEQMQVWDRDHRPGQAQFDVYPAGTPDTALPDGRIVDKRHTRVVISWPQSGPPNNARGKGKG
ncbi:methyltransferase, FxLD system [Streptomyces sp. NPDC000405]|uniref:methyltransferase, FxLD system n=1 Tax=Streptomyces sp. NPDC000405 TaxID=3161033 RepID=UPI00398D6161